MALGCLLLTCVVSTPTTLSWGDGAAEARLEKVSSAVRSMLLHMGSEMLEAWLTLAATLGLLALRCSSAGFKSVH